MNFGRKTLRLGAALTMGAAFGIVPILGGLSQIAMTSGATPTGTDTCGYQIGQGQEFSSSGSVMRGIRVIGNANDVTQLQIGAYGSDESGMNIGWGDSAATPVTPFANGTLSSPLVAGVTYNSISVNTLAAPISSGDKLTLGPNSLGKTQTVTAAASYAEGYSGSISVNSFKAQSAFQGSTTNGMPNSAPVLDQSTVNMHVTNPLIGDTSKTIANGFTYFPALYFTDITNGASTANDRQNGGKPSGDSAGNPFINDIFGEWAWAQGLTYTPTRPQVSNGWSLGSNADAPSGAFLTSLGSADGHSLEARWNVNQLYYYDVASGTYKPLELHHTYRIQATMQDGDQNHQNTGDWGEFCTTITIEKPTFSRISSFTAHRDGLHVGLTWHVPGNHGVVGFNVFRGSHRVNHRMIATHRTRTYHFRVAHAPRHSRFTLNLILMDGFVVRAHTRPV